MPGTLFVALVAGVILVTAWELDGKNVQNGMVMNAPGKSVNRLAEYQVLAYRDKASLGL
jgi:hypothetical protein